MTKPRVLWVHEGRMYPLSVGATRHEAVGSAHPASRKFLEKLLGVRLSSFHKEKTWPQTYPIYFRVVR